MKTVRRGWGWLKHDACLVDRMTQVWILRVLTSLPDTGNLREKVCSGSTAQAKSTMSEKSRQRELEATDNVESGNR